MNENMQELREALRVFALAFKVVWPAVLRSMFLVWLGMVIMLAVILITGIATWQELLK